MREQTTPRQISRSSINSYLYRTQGRGIRRTGQRNREQSVKNGPQGFCGLEVKHAELEELIRKQEAEIQGLAAMKLCFSIPPGYMPSYS